MVNALRLLPLALPNVLVGTGSGPFVIVVPLLFAIIANVLLYTIIGVVVGGTWKLLLGPRRVI